MLLPGGGDLVRQQRTCLAPARPDSIPNTTVKSRKHFSLELFLNGSFFGDNMVGVTRLGILRYPHLDGQAINNFLLTREGPKYQVNVQTL